MRFVLLILIFFGFCYSEEFEGIKYEVVAENEKYMTILVEERATLTPQNVIDYILSAEKQYPIEFVSFVTAYAYLFKKVDLEGSLKK